MKIAIPVQKFDLNKQIGEINDLNQKCLELKNECQYRSDDTRNMIFTLFNLEIQFLLLSTTLSKNLTDVNFYKQNNYKVDNIDENYLETSIYQYISSLSNSYFILMYVQLENYLRLIALHKNIHHININQIVGNFQNTFGLSDDNMNLLKIIFNLRNSMHNGGYHTHKDAAIHYKDRQFIFEKGKPIFLGEIGIVFFTFLTSEVLTSLIVEINKNTSGEEFIEHNYAKLDFEVQE